MEASRMALWIGQDMNGAVVKRAFVVSGHEPVAGDLWKD